VRVCFQETHDGGTICEEYLHQPGIERRLGQVVEVAKNFLPRVGQTRTRCVVREGNPRRTGGGRRGSTNLGARLANDDARAQNMRHRRACHSRSTGTQYQDIALSGAQRQRWLERAIDYGSNHSGPLGMRRRSPCMAAAPGQKIRQINDDQSFPNEDNFAGSHYAAGVVARGNADDKEAPHGGATLYVPNNRTIVYNGWVVACVPHGCPAGPHLRVRRRLFLIPRPAIGEDQGARRTAVTIQHL
jgi:hypothetical protein